MNWINVNDKLPSSDRLKIIYYLSSSNAHDDIKPRRPRGKITMAIYSGGEWRFIHDKSRKMKPERVTHWMHLPTVPRKSSDNKWEIVVQSPIEGGYRAFSVGDEDSLGIYSSAMQAFCSQLIRVEPPQEAE